MQLDLDQLSPGRRLRVARTATGLKLWQLAQRAGIPQSRLSEIETDRRVASAVEQVKIDRALASVETAVVNAS